MEDQEEDDDEEEVPKGAEKAALQDSLEVLKLLSAHMDNVKGRLLLRFPVERPCPPPAETVSAPPPRSLVTVLDPYHHSTREGNVADEWAATPDVAQVISLRSDVTPRGD